MRMGMPLVRTSERHLRASCTPLCPGSIQSSRITSGNTVSSSRWAAAPSSAHTGCMPLCRRLTETNSAMEGSSSTIRTRGRFFMAAGSADDRFDLLHGGMPDVRTLDHVDDEFGDVLGVIADALYGLGQEQQVEAGRDGARIFHHVGDELAHEAVEFLVDG